MHGMGHSSFRDLARLRDGKRRRESSWARSGGFGDSVPFPAGDTLVLADIAGAGLVTHIWMTLNAAEEHVLRKLVLRMYGHGERHDADTRQPAAADAAAQRARIQ